MSRIFDAIRRAEQQRQDALAEPVRTEPAWDERRFRVVGVTSNKGGVGKTTLATNLAIYARALHEAMPVLALGLDDQTTLDRTFALDPSGAGLRGRSKGRGDAAAFPGATANGHGDDLARAFDAGDLRSVVRLGQYGVEWVPSTRDLGPIKQRPDVSGDLRRLLRSADREGLVVLDTKSDFESLTRAAIDASDLVLVVIKDQASLIEAERVFDHLAARGRPAETARLVLSLVDLRVKYQDGAEADVLAHLVGEIRRAGHPLLGTFVSRSPKVEALHTQPGGRALSILHGATGSIVHGQMRSLCEEVLELVGLPFAASPAPCRDTAPVQASTPTIPGPTRRSRL